MPKLKRRILQQSRRAWALGRDRKENIVAERKSEDAGLPPPPPHTPPTTILPPPPPSPPSPTTPAASSSAASTFRVPPSAVVAELQCKKRGCRKKVAAVTPVTNKWDTTVSVDCKECGTNYCHALPRTFKLAGGEQNKYNEVNLQQVYHSLVTGEGRASLESRSAFLCTDCELTTASYARQCHFPYNKMQGHYKKGMEIVYESIKEFYTSREMTEPDEDGILDVEVSYDGTWMIRGHKSHIGIGFVTDVYTGIMLDF
ncbi:hypothetical protein E2C01_029747 [Portunus trituberculatus]|uniref:Mutator-like transposase domain-containing protein n=1 Tax=Portunus trituberculatus TaxID=210409 RepID=A0A5B7ETR2_PORTR|nr:hypothetical protein [Portunus trituberculatus]